MDESSADAALLVRGARAHEVPTMPTVGARKGEQLGAVVGVAVGDDAAMRRLLKRLGGARSFRCDKLRIDEPPARLARPAEAARRCRVEEAGAAALQLLGQRGEGEHAGDERDDAQCNTISMQRALQQYSAKRCCIGQYSGVAV